MCQVRCRCRRMLSSPANDLAGELGRNSRPKPAPRPWPAQLKLSRARQTELVICDYAIDITYVRLAEAFVYLALGSLWLPPFGTDHRLCR